MTGHAPSDAVHARWDATHPLRAMGPVGQNVPRRQRGVGIWHTGTRADADLAHQLKPQARLT
ncbi:hypothetical protein [Aeromicrobium sp.]|uniref:hypothetical protein n=1 Tax=Aeromicrobium sp. TaxID=1871063 RepID=UPI0019BEED71|nr:hypothetical protein [Aeromicrobium sp.]MBC7630216.1 hypothetical protein [Aeromicrobium sp.]